VTPTVSAALTPAQYEAGRALLEEYAKALGVDLCFQGFAEELEQLPAMYGPPGGALFLAAVDGEAIGTVAVRRFSDDTCEMKRLYVKPNFRHSGLGRTLARAAIDSGRSLGYRRMVLDTLAQMAEARQLYQSLGFVEIPAYYPNPLPGVKYLEKRL
jgi:ribosomal protein S18 acetylase RimI-like enzyme